MRIAVEFQDESLDFEVADDRLVGHWSGPKPGEQDRPPGPMALARNSRRRSTSRRCRSAVVPGDRVVVPLDPDDARTRRDPRGPRLEPLRAAEVESITVVSTAPEPAVLPEGVDWRVHDPDDRAQIAYLASHQRGTADLPEPLPDRRRHRHPDRDPRLRRDARLSRPLVGHLSRPERPRDPDPLPRARRRGRARPRAALEPRSWSRPR